MISVHVNETIYILVTCDQVLNPPTFLQRNQSQYMQSSIIVHILVSQDCLYHMPLPLPPPKDPGTHCLHMREIFRYIFVKSFVHFLVCIRKIILTKHTEHFFRSRLQQLAEPCWGTSFQT